MIIVVLYQIKPDISPNSDHEQNIDSEHCTHSTDQPDNYSGGGSEIEAITDCVCYNWHDCWCFADNGCRCCMLLAECCRSTCRLMYYCLSEMNCEMNCENCEMDCDEMDCDD